MSQLRNLCLQVIDCVAYGGDLLRILVGNLDIESFLKLHHKLDGIERVRSQVIGEALELLRQRELETSYREASRETNHDFDITLADGLSDETW